MTSLFVSFSLRINAPPAAAPAAKTAPIVLITNNSDDVRAHHTNADDAEVQGVSPSLQIIREIEQGARPTSLPKRAVSPIHAALLRHAEEQEGEVVEQPPASPRHLTVAPVSPTQRSVSPTLLAVLREEEARKHHGGPSDYAPAPSPTSRPVRFDEHSQFDFSDDVSKQSRSFRMLQAEVVSAPTNGSDVTNGGASVLFIANCITA